MRVSEGTRHPASLPSQPARDRPGTLDSAGRAARPSEARQGATRPRGNHAARRRTAPARAASTWPDVLRAVQGDETRSWALGRYKAAGFSPDEFAHLRPAREAMADALSRAEDLAETSRRIARADRDALRTVRRRLELELWP